MSRTPTMLAALAIASGCGSSQFGGPFASPAERAGSALATADLDGDGHLDVALASSDDAGGLGVVTILLGDGSGLFTRTDRYEVSVPGSVVAGDFNGDDLPDLATAAFDGQGPLDLTILTGASDGTMTPTAVPGSYWLGPLTVADFDENGSDDLAGTLVDATSLNPNAIHVMFGPDFAVQINLPLQGGGPGALDSGDVDGDGHQDLVAADGVRLGDGEGGFGTKIAFAPAETPRALCLVDLDGDGADDLVFTSEQAMPSIQVLHSDGSGRLIDAQTVAVPMAQPGPAAAADFNGNGKHDVVIGGGNGDRSSKVSLLRGDGAGGLGSASSTATTTSEVMVIADVDGDGAPDVITAGYETDEIFVLLNRP